MHGQPLPPAYLFVTNHPFEHNLEGMEIRVQYYKGKPVGIEIPNFIEAQIAHTEPAVRGDTATGVTKKVTVETGVSVQVPNFVKEGDTIRVDTRDGSYLTRV